MGADLFESYVGSLLLQITLALLMTGVDNVLYAVAPLFISGLGIIASIIATLTVKTNDADKVHAKLEGEQELQEY